MGYAHIDFSGLYYNTLSCAPVSLLPLSITQTQTLKGKTVVTIVGIICQAYDVLCEPAGFDFHWANVYLEIVDFISIRYVLMEVGTPSTDCDLQHCVVWIICVLRID